MADKHVGLLDFLTLAQVREACRIYAQFRGTGRGAAEIARQVITPNLAEINRKLGQENDARYLAYMCEYAFGRSERAIQDSEAQDPERN